MISWHKADSLRMLPSGPDLVRTAYSTRSPANKKGYHQWRLFAKPLMISDLQNLANNFLQVYVGSPFR